MNSEHKKSSQTQDELLPINEKEVVPEKSPVKLANSVEDYESSEEFKDEKPKVLESPEPE